MTRRRLLFALFISTLGLAPGSAAAQPYPLFDSHIHYSRPDWDTYTPERILSILAKAGIRRALVGSTPDEGTLKLYDKAPTVIAPALRVYRTRDDMSTWPRDPAVAAYVEERLKRGIYRAIGEAHYGVSDVTAPIVKRVADLAAQHKLFFWSHIDDATVEGMLKTYPGDQDAVGARRDVGRAPSGWASSSIDTRCSGSSWRCAPMWRPAARSIPSGRSCSCAIPIAS